MGQYYKPINTSDKYQWLLSFDYDNGLKLMEHSWVGNAFVGTVMKLLSPGGNWYKKRIVWAGDYYGEYECDGEIVQKGEVNYWEKITDENKIRPETFLTEEEQTKSILANHTKKQYIKYDELPKGEDGFVVNPLPLLTALGNNRGGGDYYDDKPDFHKIGMWANDILSIEKNIPSEYQKISVNFKDD